MIPGLALAHRALFAFDPETAHRLSLLALRSGLASGPAQETPRLRVMAAGLEFPNPVGMAAGYDKNADVPDRLLKLGFGFAEVGTVTPLPQTGNPKPRIFRLTADGAVINRLGFNNQGHERVEARLRRRAAPSGILGVNIGANKDSADRIGDYVSGVKRFAPLASYLTINISSPNTPGLRNLQGREQLAELLARVLAARSETGRSTPVFLKIAPDLGEAELDGIAGEVLAQGVEGVIVSNTTLARDGLQSPRHRDEPGGLSGRPLFARSTAALAKMRRRLGPDVPLIGVGGVDSGAAALEKIRAGADLVQLYTAMVFAGPALPARIVGELDAFAAREGLANLREIRDSGVDRWSA